MRNLPIRRCLHCNNKSHHMYWDDKRCPVCSHCEGYISSSHGGLSQEEIFEARSTLLVRLREIEGTPNLTKPGHERHY